MNDLSYSPQFLYTISHKVHRPSTDTHGYSQEEIGHTQKPLKSLNTTRTIPL